jgi:hypothetical protein
LIAAAAAAVGSRVSSLDLSLVAFLLPYHNLHLPDLCGWWHGKTGKKLLQFLIPKKLHLKKFFFPRTRLVTKRREAAAAAPSSCCWASQKKSFRI